MILNKQKLLYVFLLVSTVFVIYHAAFISSYDYHSNYKNVTIDTKVNITNAPPEVLTVDIHESIGILDNITLLAGLTRTVYCNATIRDWNGWNDINTTNATFWDDNNAEPGDIADNNEMYRGDCVNVGNDGIYLSYWQCNLSIYYYANNGSNWICNITTKDNSSFIDSLHNTTIIESLYALNLTSKEIDYGNVPVEGTSNNKTAVIENYGNMEINISVWGYAKTFGDNLAFNCSINSNISIGNERFSINKSQEWVDKTNLSSTPQMINDLSIAKQTTGSKVSNTTYWQVYIPADEQPAGQCSGNLVFEARVS
ncbi:MAG: hypothetical protein KKF89_03090 [Nanoarchaeota archaeon]|nr:hypothetical protein [Nanoarchaeota archaeon]MBU1854680.1 hypothetical protein [Nanoarchaeota archaeon]